MTTVDFHSWLQGLQEKYPLFTRQQILNVYLRQADKQLRSFRDDDFVRENSLHLVLKPVESIIDKEYQVLLSSKKSK